MAKNKFNDRYEELVLITLPDYICNYVTAIKEKDSVKGTRRTILARIENRILTEMKVPLGL